MPLSTRPRAAVRDEPLGAHGRDQGAVYKKRAIPSAERRRIAERYGCTPGRTVPVTCHYCPATGSIIWMAHYPCWPMFTFELDHVIPEFRGGPSIAENLVLACRRCNRSKGARL